jgi:hypothetical protein
MYYVGFQLIKKAKFLAFSGVAKSTDNGETFQRIQESPILDRMPDGSTIGAIHTALYEDNKWKFWFAKGNDWEIIGGKPFPRYNIWYTESLDGVSLNGKQYLCVDVIGDEYRIGRPTVYKNNDRYIMLYTKGGKTGTDYSMGYAESIDGITWERMDKKIGLVPSAEDFDNKHLCYARIVKTNSNVYGFYNGNNMGAEGFGVAELVEW